MTWLLRKIQRVKLKFRICKWNLSFICCKPQHATKHAALCTSWGTFWWLKPITVSVELAIGYHRPMTETVTGCSRQNAHKLALP